jgi:hypothetical protein
MILPCAGGRAGVANEAQSMATFIRLSERRVWQHRHRCSRGTSDKVRGG